MFWTILIRWERLHTTSFFDLTFGPELLGDPTFWPSKRRLAPKKLPNPAPEPLDPFWPLFDTKYLPHRTGGQKISRNFFSHKSTLHLLYQIFVVRPCIGRSFFDHNASDFPVKTLPLTLNTDFKNYFSLVSGPCFEWFLFGGSVCTWPHFFT